MAGYLIWSIYIICFFSLTVTGSHAVQVWVDISNGHLVETQPDNLKFGVWPTMEDQYTCTEFIDAQFMAHSGRYQVDEWLFSEHDYQNKGAIASRISIHNLEEFTLFVWEKGIWHEPDNCQSIIKLLQTYVITPLGYAIGTQERPTLTSINFGATFDLLCKESQAEEFIPCSGE